MTGNKFLLDTNIVSAYLKGDIDNVKISTNKNIFIPVIVIGELSFGAALSPNPSKYFIDIEKVKSVFDIYSITPETCYFYATIKVSLRKKGKPIPENDIWIAAIAQQHKLTLVTRDNHFKEVEDLLIEVW